MATTSKTHIGDDGFTMDFSLDVVSDIEQDVEDVARQGALGNFRKARRMYEEALKMHRDKFPIYAEFLRLCLDSGDWDSLAKPPDCGSENWSYLAAKIVHLLRFVGEISKLPCNYPVPGIHVGLLISAAIDLHSQIGSMKFEDFDNEQV
jgi:hypothetical protein